MILERERVLIRNTSAFDGAMQNWTEIRKFSNVGANSNSNFADTSRRRATSRRRDARTSARRSVFSISGNYFPDLSGPVQKVTSFWRPANIPGPEIPCCRSTSPSSPTASASTTSSARWVPAFAELNTGSRKLVDFSTAQLFCGKLWAGDLKIWICAGAPRAAARVQHALRHAPQTVGIDWWVGWLSIDYLFIIDWLLIDLMIQYFPEILCVERILIFWVCSVVFQPRFIKFHENRCEK